MTYIEKLGELHPEMDAQDLEKQITLTCPHDHFPGAASAKRPCDGLTRPEQCKACWGREADDEDEAETAETGSRKRTTETNENDGCMTFKEKYMKQRPGSNMDQVINDYCPKDFFPELWNEGFDALCDDNCMRCWDMRTDAGYCYKDLIKNPCRDGADPGRIDYAKVKKAKNRIVLLCALNDIMRSMNRDELLKAMDKAKEEICDVFRRMPFGYAVKDNVKAQDGKKEEDDAKI